MKHVHMDEFAKLRSPLHSMDPRAKILGIFIFMFLTVTISSPVVLLAAVLFWAFMLALAKVPVVYVFRRLAWVVPFAGFLIIFFPFITPGESIWHATIWFVNVSATKEGLARAIILLLRVLSSVLAIITLMSTTRFNSLMKAMGDLKIPAVFLQIIEFTVRYIFVTLDELKRMRRARKARVFTQGKNLWHQHTVKTLAQLVGVMFIRAYERGDRIYTAMLARGFQGRINTVHDFVLAPLDIIKALFILTLALALLAMDKGVIF